MQPHKNSAISRGGTMPVQKCAARISLKYAAQKMWMKEKCEILLMLQIVYHTASSSWASLGPSSGSHKGLKSSIPLFIKRVYDWSVLHVEAYYEIVKLEVLIQIVSVCFTWTRNNLPTQDLPGVFQQAFPEECRWWNSEQPSPVHLANDLQLYLPWLQAGKHKTSN